MLLALAVVVSWITIDAWRPPRQPRYRCQAEGQLSRLRDQLVNGDLDGPATYRWLQGPAVVSGEVLEPEPTTWVEPPRLAAGDPPPSLYTYRPAASSEAIRLLVDDCCLPSPPPLALSPPEALLVATKPGALPFAAALDRVDWSHPAWQLVAPPDWQHAPLAGYNAWQRCFPRRPAAPVRRYASPPTLLSAPLLTDASQRLAMLHRESPHTARIALRQSLHSRIMDMARPLMAAGLDHAVETSLLAEPTSLVELLEGLKREPECHRWASATLATLREVLEGGQYACGSSSVPLEQLAHLSLEAERLAGTVADPGLATRLRRARYAIWRRVEVWHAVGAVVSPPLDQIALAGGEASGQGRLNRRIDLQGPIAIDDMLATVEQYESQPSRATGSAVDWRLAQLADSPQASRRDLAHTLSAHYRNANVRVVITDDLLNRFLPESRTHVEPIHDRVLGTPVTGRATSQSAATVTLVPDAEAWRLGLQLTGHANSQVVAFERTVRVRTVGTTSFAARQQLVIDGAGVRTGPVTAQADSSSRFVSARSQYDIVPLLGGVIRTKAASAFANRRYRAEDEVAAKTEARVKQEMDRALRAASGRALGVWQGRVIAPLALGGVTIEPVEMTTTRDRLIARGRVLSGQSITSVTPRPRAPSDSLASLQLHQSALTNLASSLQLAGNRLTGAEFAARLQRFAPEAEVRELDDDAREAEIEFASTDPVAFELADGQLHVVYTIRELQVRGRTNSDFKVHVYYTPRADGVVARFDHHRGPYLEGDMRNSQRMRLQTIFGKVFPPGGQLVMGQRYADDPRLANLMITQLVIDDGWLAAALGPAAPERSAQLDRYAPVWR